MAQHSSDNRKPPDILADALFRQAFTELLTGSDYAAMTSGNRWDYAVEIHALRRIGLSENDLRLLVQSRFVEHAQEVTTESHSQRTFRPARGTSFAKRTCFVLTPIGIAKAQCRPDPIAHPKDVRTRTSLSPVKFGAPTWDALRRVLTYGGQTVKQFTRPAVNQELVLSAFEDEAWPSRILDPLAPHLDQAIKRRLSETIRSLNLGQATPLMHFHGDGTGEGILWKPAVEDRILRIPRFQSR
jgi:hypothetical protein